MNRHLHSILFGSTALLILALCPHVLHAKGKYRLDLSGTTVKITSPDGTAMEYKPSFTILAAEKNPHKELRRGDFGYQLKPGETEGLLYNVPTWGKAESFVRDESQHVEDGFNPEFDRSYGKGRTADYFRAAHRTVIEAERAVRRGGGIEWIFPANDGFLLSAVLAPDNRRNGLPRLTFRFTPKKEGWYSVGYTGAPAYAPDACDEFWQPHIWQEKRFPNRPYLSEAFRASIPGTLVTAGGITNSVVADPKYIPFEATPPNSKNSRFGILVRNAAGKAQSILFAPVLGNADSRMEAGREFAFDLYLFQQKAPLTDCYEYLAYNLCDFSDFRRNSTCNLNTTIENMTDYCQSPYAMFIDSLRGCNYSTDVPGAVKNISGLHALEFALLMDDEHLFRRMARPMLEYGLSRERFLFSTNDLVKGQGTSSRLHGPGVPLSDLLVTYTYANGRIPYLLDTAGKLYEQKAVRSINLDFALYEDRWLNSLELYKATGERRYLEQACADADRYLAERVSRKQTDYSDKLSEGIFFWTSYTNQWMELLQLYEATGESRYLDAAHEGARYYTQFCWLTPVVPEGTIRVNPGGIVPIYRNNPEKFTFMHLPETEVEAWKVSEIGLTPESSGTSAGHRAIFMAHHAPFMLRIAALTGDRFLHDIARAAVVGRYESFPGYHINAGRTNAFERKDFALRSQTELNGHTSIHYNHPQSHVAMLWDYLFSDVYFASRTKIDFPAEFSEGYAYCRSLIYGARPGRFYDEQDITPYMPKGMINLSDIQANYLAGYGNGKLCVAVVNQSPAPRRVTLRFDPATSFVDPAQTYRVRLWQDNKPAGFTTLKNGELRLSLSGKGITAIAIEHVDVRPRFLPKFKARTSVWARNYTSVDFENDRAVLMNFGRRLSSVYVWMEADNKRFRRVTLCYAVDGAWKELRKTGYPYEYTIEIPDDASTFEYYFKAERPDGVQVNSRHGKLFREPRQ
ncbi:hypothetical protein [uncultured Alistipes sp.]|uniref:hypothetical protein n=1 Tax=uncultured Alistipes sp. TaxID=538949 RepID=UPI0025D13B0C|nr:hypothetical protein [uncultured Alistipes sp.]